MIRIVGSTGVIITGDNSAQINQKISIRERGPLTDIDLGLLGSQLQQLRSEMKTRCSTTDQDIAVAEVARAERAATAGDQQGWRRT